MLSIAKARKDYYLQKLGEISPGEDYYLRGGAAVGHWRGSGALGLGLTGTVSTEGLVRLFDGQNPATGEQLGRQLRKDGVAAWDLTFSADKSVSLLWAFGDEAVRRHVIEAFEESTAEAVAYLESVASSTRGAARNPVLDSEGIHVLGADGTPQYRVETWPIRTDGYVSAWFTEFTSRADDPQLHTHVVVGNRVKGVDDVWRALDGRLLYRHKLAAGYLHEAELRSRLTERLGVRWQPVRNGVADIHGFTRDQIMAFSQRRQEIEAWRDERGLADTAAANEVATLATRAPKQDQPLTDLMPVWLERGAAVGVTPESVAAVLARSNQVTVPEPDPLFERLASAEGLTAKTSTFARADVIQAAASALPEGGRRSKIESLANEFLSCPDVISILPFQPHVGLPNDLPVDLDGVDVEQLDRTADSRKRPTMRRRNRDIFPGLLNERRYTTAELLSIEKRILDRAAAGIDAGRWTTSQDQLEAALASQPDLTGGQGAMVRQFATSGSAIDIGVGAAGTGKTTVMRIIGELAAENGITVIGTALAAKAAAGFETSTGISSSTITRFLWETKAAGGLPHGSIVVVDEAGMVGTRQLAQISDLVESAAGKLILIGDHRQLAEIDAGGLFIALTHRLPAVELTENVRQLEEWERTALKELRDGSVERAVAMYDRRGLINVTSSTEDAIDQAVGAWHQDMQSAGHPAEVLLIGDRNDTVRHLNLHARRMVGEAGRLTGPTVSVDDREFRAGDRVVCLKNRNRLGVLNGDLATVQAVDTNRRVIKLRLDRTGQDVAIPWWYLDEGNVDWGYAITGHKAQGTTARRVHTVARGGVDREWIYVTMSRGREANTIYLTDPGLDGDDCEHVAHEASNRMAALMAALGTTTDQLVAHDTGRGPEILTDAQIRRAIAELGARLASASGEGPGTSGGDHQSLAADHARLTHEQDARHRDRFAAAAYEPPSWIVRAIGERPADPAKRSAWDRAVDRSLRYREQHPVTGDVEGLIGPMPLREDMAGCAEWLLCRRVLDRDLTLLSGSMDRRSAISIC